MTVESRRRLLDHLRKSAIAGDVATPREANLRSYRNFAPGRRLPQVRSHLGSPHWTPDDVLAVMVRRCGVDPDPRYLSGPDTIDPNLTLAQLDAAGARIGEIAAARGSVLLATGHPSGLLQVHLELAAALRRAGCRLLTPGSGLRHIERRRGEPEEREVRYVGDVAMVSDHGALNHTHSARPMQGILELLDESGQDLPDLVVADHGWAGAAEEAGLSVVGFLPTATTRRCLWARRTGRSGLSSRWTTT